MSSGASPGSTSGTTRIQATDTLFSLSTGQYLELSENAGDANPLANKARLCVKDNGAGKTQLGVLFNTGGFIQLAIEP